MKSNARILRYRRDISLDKYEKITSLDEEKKQKKQLILFAVCRNDNNVREKLQDFLFRIHCESSYRSFIESFLFLRSPLPPAVSFLPTPLARSGPVFVLPAFLLRYGGRNHPRAVNPLIYSRRFLEFCQPRPQSALVLFTLLVHRRQSSPSFSLSIHTFLSPSLFPFLSRVSSILLSKSKLTSSCPPPFSSSS